MIVFHEVVKVYATGARALDNVSFNIAERDFVFLVGASGAGKTTLIRLVNKDQEPTSGSIFVDGMNIPLAFAGLAVAVAGGTPNTISATTNGAGPGKPALTAKYDWIFVHLAQTPPSTVFCCPEGGPSQ